jgi:hypothetical protein
MKQILTVFCMTLTLLAPGPANARKPVVPEPACALLLSPDPQFVYTGMPFTVKLVRVPAYPGAFRQPTVEIDVSYPMPPGNEITQNYTRTIPVFNVTYVEADFTPPASDSGIVENGVVGIEATVTEPVRKNKSRTTSCSTTATVVYSN